MILIKAKANQGKTTEILKRFITDPAPATYITDEMSPDGIHQIIGRLTNEGVKIENQRNKKIKSICHIQHDEPGIVRYQELINNNCEDNLYLDIIAGNKLDDIINYCMTIEYENNIKITLGVQLKANADKGIHVEEI